MSADLIAPVERELTRIIARQLGQADLVLVSDYDKGVCTPRLLASVISAAAQAGVRTLIDPIRGSDYRKYHGCSAITPNRLEAGLATGRTLNSPAQIVEAATHLREQLDLEAAGITRSEEHTSELQSRENLVCRLLLEKKKKKKE